jgi:hypothetical protein
MEAFVESFCFIIILFVDYRRGILAKKTTASNKRDTTCCMSHDTTECRDVHILGVISLVVNELGLL